MQNMFAELNINFVFLRIVPKFILLRNFGRIILKYGNVDAFIFYVSPCTGLIADKSVL